QPVGVAAHQIGPGGVGRFDEQPEKVWRDLVVRVGEGEELAGGMVYAEVAGGADTGPATGEYPEPAGALCDRVDDSTGAVRGTVVHDQHLEVGECLRLEVIKQILYVIGNVFSRDDDADTGHLLSLPILGLGTSSMSSWRTGARPAAGPRGRPRPPGVGRPGRQRGPRPRACGTRAGSGGRRDTPAR